jgi:WD40 repeat protein
MATYAWGIRGTSRAPELEARLKRTRSLGLALVTCGFEATQYSATAPAAAIAPRVRSCHSVGYRGVMDRELHWNPRGTSLLANEGVLSLDRKAKVPAELRWTGRDHIAGADWSPDGKTFAGGIATHLPQSLFLWSWKPATGELTRSRLVGRDFAEYAFSPRWEPGGRRIAFIASHLPNESPPTHSLCVVPARGGQARVLASGVQGDQPYWSPKGGRILVKFLADPPTKVCLVDASSGRIESFRAPLPDQAGLWRRVAWSPDGRKIAFCGRVGPRDSGAVAVLDLKRRWSRLLAPIRLSSDDHALDPAWSPDGRSIAFTVQRGGVIPHRGEIRLLDVGTGRRRTVFRGENLDGFAWSRDGAMAAVRNFSFATETMKVVVLQTGNRTWRPRRTFLVPHE